MYSDDLVKLFVQGEAVERLSSIRELNKILQNKKEDFESHAEDIFNNITKLDNEISVCEESQEYYKRAVDVLYSRSIGELENFINNSLSYVFYDKPYRVKLELDFTRGKKSVSILLLDYTNDEDPVEVDIKDGVGNGIRTVISFILSVYYILAEDAYPILMLDESYSYLSSQYVQRFFEMVKGFCDRKNLRVVLISHDVRFLDFSDKKYVVADGVVSEV